MGELAGRHRPSEALLMKRGAAPASRWPPRQRAAEVPEGKHPVGVHPCLRKNKHTLCAKRLLNATEPAATICYIIVLL